MPDKVTRRLAAIVAVDVAARLQGKAVPGGYYISDMALANVRRQVDGLRRPGLPE